jgi:fluoroquinolone transport system permease protein
VRVTPAQFWSLVRAVPRAASFAPLLSTAAATSLFVLTASVGAVPMRLRLSAAAVAATACFVLDDDAALTLAPVPITRLTRRLVRYSVAAAIVAAWLAVIAFAADALTGVGRPPTGFFVEIGVVGLVAAAAACLAIGRSDDGRGGVTGAMVGLVCAASTQLPARWLPLTAQPEMKRLTAVALCATAVALVASADPAKRRVPRS